MNPPALEPALTSGPGAVGNADAVAEQVRALGDQLDGLRARYDALAEAAGMATDTATRLEVFHGYFAVFIVAFTVSLLLTPVMRKIATRYGVVDHPSELRKAHGRSVAYLGGVSVFFGIITGLLLCISYPLHGLIELHDSPSAQIYTANFIVPPWILLGLTVICVIGLIDDVGEIGPRLKIAGQLFAAAAVALGNIGTNLARGLVNPIGSALNLPTIQVDAAGTQHVGWIIELGSTAIPIDVVYWTGVAIIAVFVLGACNASNLIDGLDGLLSGVTAISSAGLLVVALGLALQDDGPHDPARIAMCLALLGACLGFLPHNFNPASIFLGDCGSMILGYMTIVIVLSLGDTGRTPLVIAGLIIYGLPIVDTVLAIVRRKVGGKKISDADDQHLHHMLKRALGVKRAVLVLYAITAGFALLGVALTEGRGRVTYGLALVFASFIGVTAFKIARRAHIEEQAAREPAAPEPAEPAQPAPDDADQPPAAAAIRAQG